VNNVTVILLNEEMTKIKVVDLDEFYNYTRNVNFVNNVTVILLNEEMTKIKIVDLDEFYNFYVHDFFS
jgi:hypothetical protein